MSAADSPRESGEGSGRVFVVSGPTAVGKGTVVTRLRQLRPDVVISVSATTRPARKGEINGLHYYFLTNEQFDELIAGDGLLEWAIVHGRYRYGTPREPVRLAVEAGRRVVLEIDLQGARQVRTSMPEATFIFLAPPSWSELVNRLVGRGTENTEERARRLVTAEAELASQPEFDHTIVNGEIGQASDDLVGLLGL